MSRWLLNPLGLDILNSGVESFIFSEIRRHPRLQHAHEGPGKARKAFLWTVPKDKPAVYRTRNFLKGEEARPESFRIEVPQLSDVIRENHSLPSSLQDLYSRPPPFFVSCNPNSLVFVLPPHIPSLPHEVGISIPIWLESLDDLSRTYSQMSLIVLFLNETIFISIWSSSRFLIPYESENEKEICLCCFPGESKI